MGFGYVKLKSTLRVSFAKFVEPALAPDLYPGRCTPVNSWCWCAAWFSKSWLYFQTKWYHFSHPFSDLTCKIHTRFQTWHLSIIMSSLLRLEQQQKRFLKFHSNSHISLSFLLIWNGNDKYIHILSKFPRKHPIPDQNGQSLYQFSDQNGTKTRPDGAAHTYMAYKWEVPPGDLYALVTHKAGFSWVHEDLFPR